MQIKSTGERLEFFEFSDVTIEHLHRYAIANDFVKSKIVLDIASGEGYGSNILSNTAAQVIGVDIDIDTIKKANKKYVKNNLKFIVGSADCIPVESNSIDVVVSFETIEHHDKHEEMFIEIKRVLKTDGILIISSPDKLYYSDKSGYKNQFHTKELYFEEFKLLIQNNFKNSFFYFQKTYNLNSYISNFSLFESMIIYSGDNTRITKSLIEPLYNLAIASDSSVVEIQPSIFNGNQVKNLLINKKINKVITSIKNTKSFRIGNFLIFPLKYLRKKIDYFK